MMFDQITGRASLQDISVSLQTQAGSLYHLGIQSVNKSTFADANNNRSANFSTLFLRSPTRAVPLSHRAKRNCASKTNFTRLMRPPLISVYRFFPRLDSVLPRVGSSLHAVLDHDGHIPAFTSITDAKTSDLSFDRTLTLPAGSIVAVDRAYIDFAWLYALNQRKNYLVTRLKSNIKYRVVERRSVLKSKGVTSDQTIILTGTKAGDCPIPLRRIGYKDPNTGKQYVFLTNNFQLAAKTIADIYKARCKIELFFKWIKQNLKIKTFFGTSRNAVITQIQRLLQLNLFKRQTLWALFDPPLAENKIEFRQKLLLNFS